jgi:2'-hydroxyisoflavone reductase
MTLSRRELLYLTGAGTLLASCAPMHPPPRVVPRPGQNAAPPGQESKPSAPMSILILGGTKFLGPDIVEAAVAAGHKVTLFNRGKTNPGLFPDLETLIGDRDGKLDALRGRKWDAVIDTSGYVPRVVKQSAELLAPNVGQYVFVSSISVYADPLAAHSDESAPLARLDDPASEDVPKYYGALKAACEATVEAALPGRTTNVRPGLIVGPGDPSDRFTYWPARMDRGGEVLAPGDGSDFGQVIDARDLGAWLVKCVVDRTVGVYNAVGPAEPMTIKTMLDACNRAAGNKATLTWVPTRFLEEKEVQPWMELPVWTAGDLGFATVKSDRAQAKGLTFRPIDDTARATLEWWRTEPEERKAKPKAGLAPEKEAAVLAAWKASQAPK